MRSKLLLLMLTLMLTACTFLDFAVNANTGSRWTPIPQASGIITNVVMAKDIQGDNYTPIGITSNFPLNPANLYCVIMVKDAPSGTILEGDWVAVDTNNAIPPNTLITHSVALANGSYNSRFVVTPLPGRIPPGKYRIDIYLNRKIEGAIEFSIASQ